MNGKNLCFLLLLSTSPTFCSGSVQRSLALCPTNASSVPQYSNSGALERCPEAKQYFLNVESAILWGGGRPFFCSDTGC